MNEINKETKKLDVLLKIGLAMISLSGFIFATSTWNETPNIGKVVLLIVFGILFMGMSIFSDRKLKIQSTTMTYWILSLLFIIFSTVAICALNIISPWFSYMGDGRQLCFALNFFVTSIAAYLSYKKFSKKFFLGTFNIMNYLTLYSFMFFTNLNHYISLIIIIGITLLISFVCDQYNTEYTHNLRLSSRIISYIYIPIIISFMFSEANVSLFVTTIVLQMINFIYQALTLKEDNNGVLSVIANFILLLLLIHTKASSSILLPIIFGYTTVITLIGYISKIYEKNPMFFIANTFLGIGLTLFAFGFSYITNVYSQIVIAILIILPGVVSYIKKDTYIHQIEEIVSPFKFILSIIIAISLFSKNIYKLDSQTAISINSLISGILYLVSRKKHLKISYLVSYMIFLVLGFVEGSNSIINIVLNIAIAILLFIIVYKNEKANKLLPIVTGVMLLAIYKNIADPNVIKINRIAIDIFVILSYIIFALSFKKDKKIYIPALILLILPLMSINKIINIEWINTIFIPTMALYILGLMCELVIKKDENLIASIGTSVVLYGLVFDPSVEIGVYVGIVSVLAIIIGLFLKKYKSLFVVGTVFTVLNIIYKLRNVWGKLPFWLYLLISGIVLVGIVTYIQLKNANNSKQVLCNDDEKEVNYDEKS